MLQSISNNINFGQRLENVKITTNAGIDDPNNSSRVRKATMLIDNTKVSVGDTFYILDTDKASDKMIQEAKFRGAKHSTTNPEGKGHYCKEIFFKTPDKKELSKLSTYKSEHIQFFTKEGLAQLLDKMTKLLKK